MYFKSSDDAENLSSIDDEASNILGAQVLSGVIRGTTRYKHRHRSPEDNRSITYCGRHTINYF